MLSSPEQSPLTENNSALLLPCVMVMLFCNVSWSPPYTLECD